MKTNRRRTYIVDKHFQMRFIALAVMTLVIVVNVVIITLLAQPLFEQQTSVVDTAILGIVELILVLGAYHLGIRTSNRIAGPVYVMANSVRRLGDGDLAFQIRLRRDDYFKTFGEDMNASIERLRQRIVEIKQTTDALDAKLPDSGEARELSDRLRRQLADFHTGSSPNDSNRKPEQPA